MILPTLRSLKLFDCKVRIGLKTVSDLDFVDSISIFYFGRPLASAPHLGLQLYSSRRNGLDRVQKPAPSLRLLFSLVVRVGGPKNGMEASGIETT